MARLASLLYVCADEVNCRLICSLCIFRWLVWLVCSAVDLSGFRSQKLTPTKLFPVLTSTTKPNEPNEPQNICGQHFNAIQLIPRSYIHCRAKRAKQAAKYMRPTLKPHTNYSSFLTPLPSQTSQTSRDIYAANTLTPYNLFLVLTSTTEPNEPARLVHG